MTLAAKIHICVYCRHHRNTHHGIMGAGPPPNTWYYQLCAHPELERPAGIDPTTGGQVFWAKNDLGRTVPSLDKHPYCRDVNPDGLCELFEAKGGAK